jgi:murein DD-endopeptidase MepM/ murein hydrolase activator NlpD
VAVQFARTGVVVVVVLSLVASPRASAAAEGSDDPTTREPVAYSPPVDEAPLIDLFRPPATAYGAGNRGIDYGTVAGTPVRAAAAGEVVYAGQVGASRHVVVLHADGLRTSYSFLATTTVRRGAHVEAGETVGTTSEQPLHFGVRAPGDGNYLDPLALFGPPPTGNGDGQRHRPAQLVADPHPDRPLAESVERRHLVDSLRGLVHQGGTWLLVSAER